jgi:hypothetical protein
LALAGFFGIGYLIHRYESRLIEAAEQALPGPLEGVIAPKLPLRQFVRTAVLRSPFWPNVGGLVASIGAILSVPISISPTAPRPRRHPLSYRWGVVENRRGSICVARIVPGGRVIGPRSIIAGRRVVVWRGIVARRRRGQIVIVDRLCMGGPVDRGRGNRNHCGAQPMQQHPIHACLRDLARAPTLWRSR